MCIWNTAHARSLTHTHLLHVFTNPIPYTLRFPNNDNFELSTLSWNLSRNSTISTISTTK